MTMAMTEIVGSEIEINHIVETNHGIITKVIDLIVEINYKTITEITIGKKIIERPKIGNIEVDRDYYGDTCDDRYIDNCRNTYKDSNRDKYRDNYRDDSFDSDRDSSTEKHCLHNARKDNGFVSNNPKVEQLHKVLQQLSPDKVVAIRFILASSVNFDDMFDSIHSSEDVDCLIAERIMYLKNQEVENLADENSSSIDSQNDVNHVNHELIEAVKDERDICLTQDSQEDFDFIDNDYILNEFIDGEIDNCSIELSIPYVHEEIDYQIIDKSETTKLQDVPIQVAIEHKIEECIEEVASDVTLPEVYRVDEKIHTDIKLETPTIKAERCIVQDEPKLVQDRTLICDTPTTIQTIAEPMIEQQISSPDRALQGKLIPKTHASWRETLRPELVRKEIPTYTDSICKLTSKPPDKQNSLEGEISKEISPYIDPIYRPPSQVS